MTSRQRIHIQQAPDVTVVGSGSTAEGWPFYIQDDAPAHPPAEYAWLQTNYPNPGDSTLWLTSGV